MNRPATCNHCGRELVLTAQGWRNHWVSRSCVPPQTTTVTVNVEADSAEEAIDFAAIDADLTEAKIDDVTVRKLRTLWVVEFTIDSSGETAK